MEKYLDALVRDIMSRRTLPVFLKSIYIGGGTPSLLSSDEFNKLFSLLRNSFAINKKCEITVELNPESASERLFETLKKNGVNRISIGFQFLENRLLKKSGRLHSAKRAIDAFRKAKNCAFKNINADIIYGFPSQTAAELNQTLNKTLSLKPAHISAYLYTPPQHRKNLFSAEKHSDEETLKMYRLICRRMSQNGFHHYEISNFALRGKESVHNLSCWNQSDYIGCGAAAVSTINGVRTKNAKLLTYIKYPLKRKKERLTPEKLKLEKKFLAGRTKKGIPTRKKHTPFIKAGWLREKNGRSVFTEEGWFLSSSIIPEL